VSAFLFIGGNNMVIVKMDGANISDGPFENFAHAARWFANNGVCHGARKSVHFDIAQKEPVKASAAPAPPVETKEIEAPVETETVTPLTDETESTPRRGRRPNAHTTTE
jgi:hypothetical protein